MDVSTAREIFQQRIEYCVIEVVPQPKMYFNDILAACQHEFDKHLEQINKILEKFKGASIQINLPKSVLCQKQLEWLGFRLSQEGYQLIPDRIQGILDIALLRNKKEVQMYCTMVNFIQNYIKNRAEMLEPLTRLTKDSEPWAQKEE